MADFELKTDCRISRYTKMSNVPPGKQKAHNGFSLVEAVTSLMILALLSSTVLVVYDRCMASAADSLLAVHAFHVASENLETLLSAESAKEMAEFGSSDRYPEIQWQTVVEPFYEPVTQRMWVQAVCSAEYTDSTGQLQNIELVHWLTDVTEAQLRQIIEQMVKEKEQSADQLIQTVDDAAAYARVDVETIDQWIENGMLTSSDGYYFPDELDLYKQTNGKPTFEDRRRQTQAAKQARAVNEKADKLPEGQQDDVKTIGGRTFEQLVESGFPVELLEKLFKE